METPWSKVIGRKSKRVTIVGSNSKAKTDSKKMMGIAKTMALHVYRLSPETTVNYLKFYFLEVKYVQLNFRNPRVYSSFCGGYE